MEIEIISKKNNPLLNRTEVNFIINHEGEKTPNREIIRGELADKLNSKKENIIVSSISSSFGVQKTTGYAKVYSSMKNTKGLERKHILIRNKIVEEKKKDEQPKGGKPATEGQAPAEPVKEEPKPEPETAPEPQSEPKKPAEDKQDEKTVEQEQAPVEEPTEDKTPEPEKSDEEKPEEKPAEEKPEKEEQKDEKPDGETKEEPEKSDEEKKE